MKKFLVLCAMALWIASASSAEITSQELLNAVDKMTPEQADAFSKKLDARLWKPVPEGFFSRMAVDVGISGAALDTLDLSSVNFSGGEQDLDAVGGLEFGLLWRAFSPRCRLGLRLDSWESSDSNLGDGGYSRADISGGSVLLVANYQWIRNDSWLLWTEVGAGGGGAVLDTVDTPAGQATTLRSFDESYGQIDLLGGVSWRFNPIVSVFASGGYHFADSVELEEGGQNSAVKLDASGGFGRLGLGFNY